MNPCARTISAATLILKKAVENYFTAKTPRAQRTYRKNRIHPLGQNKAHTHFNPNNCFSLASSRLCGGSFIPTTFFRFTIVPLAAFFMAVTPVTLATAGDADFSESVRLYETERRSVAQFYDLSWSSVRQQRMDKLYAEWQETLAATDFATLSQGGRIDWLLLREQLEYERAKLGQDRKRLDQIAELLPFAATVEALELARWRMKPLDFAAAAKDLAVIPEQIRQLRGRLELGRKAVSKEPAKDSAKDPGKELAKEPGGKNEGAKATPDAGTAAGAAVGSEANQAPLVLTPLLAFRAARTSNGIRQGLKAWHESYAGSQPEFNWWMKAPYEEIDKALEEYAKFLREEIAGVKGEKGDPLLGEALGAGGLARDLALEYLPYTAQELLTIGEREFAWCEARMKESANAMGLGDDWHAALAKVKSHYVPPGKQEAYIAEQAAEAIAFLKQRDLVTVPPLCEETWRIAMISTEEQRQTPYVAYNDMHILVAYARDDMSNADKIMTMRGNNLHFSRLTTAHELIPGHHLQKFYAQRFRSYRESFSTPFLVEGWALYWEMALWDQGYARSPEDQIGMLFWRMHRAARIIVSLKFHLEQMTPPQMVDFLVDRVGHERLGATSEVRRFIAGDFSPLYQCGYMIGGLQLRALAKEMIASGMTVKQFNDAVLRCGEMPIEMIRASLLNLPLTRDSRAQWRFDG